MSKFYIQLALSLTGFFGILVETLFSALRCSDNMDPKFAYLLALNEINWIVYESSTVLYSYIKTRTAIRNCSFLNVCNMVMIFAFIAFTGARIYIGWLRFTTDTLMDLNISRAHSYAFLVWGASDLVVFGLMMFSTWNQLQTSDGSQTNTSAKVLVKSSIPRISVLCCNTFSIVVVAQLPVPLSPIMAGFNRLIWMVKGTYPSILLLDMLLTKEMLMSYKTEQVQDISELARNSVNYLEKADGLVHSSKLSAVKPIDKT
ncbi:hypothetical protein BC830DRAFT_1158763 [Chytriomyces sp. MP71]|nr:hypothetical protein BC830DRAFT_1158763 [Chytriomyces sp. MP71]